MKKILALLSALWAVPAFGQAVQQSGTNITPGHVATWVTTGVIGDGGAPAGGPSLVGSFVINDMLCASATGTSISVIDCGFSATGTNNWVGVQNLNGGATAPTRAANDSTTNVATTAFVQNFGAAPANVMNFGAKCDGSTDDTTAIQTVLNAYKYVLIPASVSGCKVSTITVGNLAYQVLAGAGPEASFLTSSSTTVDIIQMAAAVPGLIIRDLGLKRSVTASAGCGIDYLGYVDLPQLVDIEVQQQYVGVCLSSTGYGIFRHSYIHNNISDGWTIKYTTTNNEFQWYVDTVLSANNGGRCVTVTAPNSGISVTMGTWTNTFCFANAGKGAAFLGNSTVSITGVRIVGGFWGTDGDVEGYFDTYGGQHQITGLFTELSGTNSCIQFTANNTEAILTGVTANACATAGITNAATTMLNMVGGKLGSNGTYGLVNAGVANLTGVEFLSNTSGTVSNSGTFTGRGNSPASVDTLLGLAQGGTNANLSATGGTSQVLKQISSGAAVTVGQLQCTDLSTAGTACTANTGTSGATVPLLNGNNTNSGLNTFSGQIVSTFGTPTIASGACGTGTNGSISGTNQSGSITIGASATTTCTISFSTTITAPGACLIFPGNATAAATGTTVARVGTPSATAWVVTGSALANTVYSYICL